VGLLLSVARKIPMVRERGREEGEWVGVRACVRVKEERIVAT
jgi:hypothetical protein